VGEFKKVTKDLARIYHYLIHGKDGKVSFFFFFFITLKPRVE